MYAEFYNEKVGYFFTFLLFFTFFTLFTFLLFFTFLHKIILFLVSPCCNCMISVTICKQFSTFLIVFCHGYYAVRSKKMVRYKLWHDNSLCPWQEDGTFWVMWLYRYNFYTSKTRIYDVKRNWVFVINSDFLIPISLQPNVTNLRYLKLWILFDQIF